jgi:hypothetical protein
VEERRKHATEGEDRLWSHPSFSFKVVHLFSAKLCLVILPVFFDLRVCIRCITCDATDSWSSGRRVVDPIRGRGKARPCSPFEV